MAQAETSVPDDNKKPSLEEQIKNLPMWKSLHNYTDPTTHFRRVPGGVLVTDKIIKSHSSVHGVSDAVHCTTTFVSVPDNYFNN